MNYGKESLSKKKKNVSSKKYEKRNGSASVSFKAVVICFLLICIIGAVGGGLFVKKIIDDAPEITPASVKPSGYKSRWLRHLTVRIWAVPGSRIQPYLQDH